MLLPVTHNAGNNFTIARLHYMADPEKDQKWVDMAKQGMPEQGWEREYEISYEWFGGKAFFGEFKEYNVKHTDYRPRETVYRGWDYGYHRPACHISVINQRDQWCWLEAVLGKDEGIFEFGSRIRNYCLSHYPGAYFIDAGDPAGLQVTDKGDKTSVQILQTLGIYVRSRKQPIAQGAEIIRQKLQMRVDGVPGMLVNPDQTAVIDGFKGGLHYPEEKEGVPMREYYEKDGYYDHIFDAARYIATEMFSVIGQQMVQNEITHDPNQDRYRMGAPASDDHEENPSTMLSDEIFSDPTDLGGYE